ncbi:hypothetical protein [Methylocystis parvus]|uniref:Uncharacterized protein n=1 Tax=Methylocystis parvus TaxID=134 RepID=A0A6B8M420_9HYPH|nr:hypothetical protein [Methylocystis parvus]QGM96163.1 hypothetical protein F7D14_00745 [Methylocystis parvus]WBK00013.1 hypothetical protein MMG94_18865 [Methylocystis parvus OBBP]
MTFELGLFDITRVIEVNLSDEPLPNLKVNTTATFLHAVVSKDNNIPSQAGSDLLGALRRVVNLLQF